MSNVIPLIRSIPFTEEIPEQATLLELCTHHAVKVMTISNDIGAMMIIAWFIDIKSPDKFIHIYQNGDTARMAHLFFWLGECKFNPLSNNLKNDALSIANAALGGDWIIEE